ncbi:accessory Sec system protein Asp2 [Oceanobacillus sp. FSL W8-0428]|uniref:accessory Sec system protein Asp2 n=1 Tax=Oceanobacillus sp. FSL W8-0428 TaxID=2921715 RepID=UPI0030F7A173
MDKITNLNFYQTFDTITSKKIIVNTYSDKNLIKLARRNKDAYKLYKKLLENNYMLYFHKDGKSHLYNRKYISEIWKRKDLYQQGEIFYTIDKPEGRKNNELSDDKRLLVIFTCMPANDNYDNHSLSERIFPKFFDGIERNLVKNVYIMRITDLNLSHGSHYQNTDNYPTMERDIIDSIKNVQNELDITDEKTVLYGVSKGGTGALHYGSMLDLKSLSVDPILNLEEYNQKDEHFLKDLRKIDVTEDINSSLARQSNRKKYIIGSQNVEFNYSKIVKITGSNTVIINKKDNHIKEHPDVSRNTVPEQLMILNHLLGGIQL